MKVSSLLFLMAVLAVASGYVQKPGHLLVKPATRGQSTVVSRSMRKTSHSALEKETIVVAQGAESNQVNSWKGPACVLGGALAHLTLGTLYCWGNFLSYAPSYLRFFDGQDHVGVQPDALYVIPFAMFSLAAAMPFGPSIVKSIGASRTMLLGSWISAFAVYMASYQTSLASFIFFYSLLFGAGAGLAYTAPMAAGWRWLPGSKGLVSGGVLAGFGSGGFLFSMIGSRHVNPNGANMINGRFPASVYSKFPSMLRKLSVIYAVVAFIGSCLVSEPPVVTAAAGSTFSPISAVPVPHVPFGKVQKFTGPLARLPPALQIQLRNVLNRIPELMNKLPPPVLKLLTDLARLPANINRNLKQKSAVTAIDVSATIRNSNSSTSVSIPVITPVSPSPGRISPKGLTLSQALRTKQFWILWSMIITCATAGLNTAAVYKQFASTSVALTGDEFQALVGGIGALFNGVGRIFWGGVSDRLGFKASFTVLSILQAALMLTYTLAAGSKAMFAANTCMLFFTLAGNFALFPPAVQRIFGTESGAVIYGVLYSAFATASVVGGILTKVLVKKLGWERVFQTMAAMSLVATGLVMQVKPVKGYDSSVV